jgi:hypothetical protein
VRVFYKGFLQSKHRYFFLDQKIPNFFVLRPETINVPGRDSRQVKPQLFGGDRLSGRRTPFPPGLPQRDSPVSHSGKPGLIFRALVGQETIQVLLPCHPCDTTESLQASLILLTYYRNQGRTHILAHPQIHVRVTVQMRDAFYLNDGPSELAEACSKFSPHLRDREPLHIVQDKTDAVAQFQISEEGHSSDFVGLLVIMEYGSRPTSGIPNSNRTW